ncbi:MAG: hypothetical protein FJ211_11000, partial [Ignavibacteria bacterium]|nr:hypothetical protein [Ignavibacteria bacterium]
MTIKALSYPTSRPTLDLNFAQTKRLDPRVTFSRSSAGTNFNANGVLQSAATNTARFDHSPVTGESLGLLVEEARTNLIQGSIHHINTYWTAINVNAVPNSSLNLDGTITAATITTTSTNSQHVYHTTTQVSQASCAFSLLIKAGTARYVALSDGPNTAFSYTVYDLQLGTVVSSGGINTPAGFISSLGNGWFRITQTGGRNNQWLFILNNSLAVTHSESGLSVIVGGVQVETGSFPTSYIPTPATFTGRASTATFYNSSGIIQTAAAGVARSAAFFPDSNGVFRPAGLLLEAAGTNLALHSEALGSWANNGGGIAITSNVEVAPDGTTTADRLAQSAVTNAGRHLFNGGSSVRSGQTFTTSFWIRRVSGTDAQPTIRVYGIGGGPSQIVTATSSWQRITWTWTALNDGGNYEIGSVGFSWDINGAANNNVYSIWGFQVEQNPYATSYIPTVASTVTRSADTSTSATVTRSADVANITGTNFSSWHIQG